MYLKKNEYLYLMIITDKTLHNVIPGKKKSVTCFHENSFLYTIVYILFLILNKTSFLLLLSVHI